LITTYKIKIRSKIATGWGNGNACSICNIFLDNTEIKSSIAVKVNQSPYRPGVAQRVPGIKVHRFHDNGTGWW